MSDVAKDPFKRPEGWSEEEGWLNMGLMMTDGPWVDFNEDIWKRVSEQTRKRLRDSARYRGMEVKNDTRRTRSGRASPDQQSTEKA